MKDKIIVNEQTPIKALIESYPAVYGALLSLGVSIVQRKIKEEETVGHYVPADKNRQILEALNEVVRRQAVDFEQLEGLRDQLVQPGKVNIAGFADFTWHEGFETEMKAFAAKENIELNFQFFMKNNKKLFQRYLVDYTSADNLPDILVGKGFSSLMTRKFSDTFIKTGCFDCPLEVEVHPLWKQIGLYDTAEQYHAFGAEEQVILRDNTKKTTASNPEYWSDLLKPEYTNTVTQMGKPQRDHFGFNSLFYLNQQYGEQGIRNYARAVQYKWHFSKIIKDIGRDYLMASPFNVVKRYTTLFVRHNADVEVLTLKDGNPVTTFFCLVKKNSNEEVLKTARHLFSKPIAGLIEHAGAVSAHPESEVTAHANLRWIGWEAVKSANLPFLKEELSEIAFDEYNKTL